jgi:hypothetical protein
MFTDFLVQITMVLALAGAEALRRQEMVIRVGDLRRALGRLYPNDVFGIVTTKPTLNESQELYALLHARFGPGINMTCEAFALFRGMVYTWHRRRLQRVEVLDVEVLHQPLVLMGSG